MNLQFTLLQMRSALEKIGYEIREEQEVEKIDHPGGYVEERTYRVLNLYLNGEPLKDYIPPRLSGTQRLEFVFKQELNKRVIGLF